MLFWPRSVDDDKNERWSLDINLGTQVLECRSFYKGRSINKLQNSIILLMFIIRKIRNMRFVRNIIASTKCEFYFDDVTVTSFIDIKCGDVAIQSIP